MEKELDNIFERYIITFAQVRLISIYNFNLFTTKQISIPNELHQRYSGSLKKIIDNFETKEHQETEIPQDAVDFIKATSVLIKYNSEEYNKETDQIILRQDIITFFAYLEAFFQDIQRFIFSYDNSLLASKDKTLTWNEILEKSAYKDVIEVMIDKQLEKSGYVKIHDLIKKWKLEPYKIIIKLKKEHLEYLKKYTLIRNIVVHNNSKISNDLIEFRNEFKGKLGVKYHFSFEEVFKLYDFMNWLLFETFATVKQKFFNSDYETLCDEYNYVKNYEPSI